MRLSASSPASIAGTTRKIGQPCAPSLHMRRADTDQKGSLMKLIYELSNERKRQVWFHTGSYRDDKDSGASPFWLPSVEAAH